MSKKVLIIDDDGDICLLLERFLNKKGFDAAHTRTGEEAMILLKKHQYEVVLCDYRLPDATGLEMIQRIKIVNPEAIIIIITGYSDVRTAVLTLKQGAYEYVTKPLYPDEILLTINSALRNKSNQVTDSSSKTSVKKRDRSVEKTFVKGKSKQAETVQKHIELIAPTDMSVIILGETGTGKEFVAKAIHQKSNRKEAAFIAIDCGALPKDLAGSELFGHVKGAFTGALSDKKGSFELADGGTLFLDEIGNLSYDNQIKLLRVLQERKIKKLGGVKDIDIDVRIIVATNEDLKKAVKKGTFREDIYHRVNEFKIELSPLRERKGDIMIFANHFLRIANQQLDKDVFGFDEEATECLRNYYWFGNLRELQNVVKRAVLLASGDYISLECIPNEIVSPDYTELETEGSEGIDATNLKSAHASAERQVIINVLEKTGNNKTKAAEVLNIDRKTLYNKLKAYNIKL